MTKICSRCNEERDEAEFPWRNKAKGKHRSYCLVCQRAMVKRHYENNKGIYLARARKRNNEGRQLAREFVFEFLSKHPCVDCGETDPVVLEFDHQRNKIDDVSNLVRAAVNLERIEAEIEKCEVVCANCHKRRTAKANNWYKNIAKKQMRL